MKAKLEFDILDEFLLPLGKLFRAFTIFDYSQLLVLNNGVVAKSKCPCSNSTKAIMLLSEKGKSRF